MRIVAFSVTVYVLALCWIIHKYMPKEEDVISAYEEETDIFEEAIEELDKNEKS